MRRGPPHCLGTDGQGAKISAKSSAAVPANGPHALHGARPVRYPRACVCNKRDSMFGGRAAAHLAFAARLTNDISPNGPINSERWAHLPLLFRFHMFYLRT